MLPQLVAYLEAAGAATVTSELAIAWARLPGHAHPNHWAQRLAIARGFARYLQVLDPATDHSAWAGVTVAHKATAIHSHYQAKQQVRLIGSPEAIAPAMTRSLASDRPATANAEEPIRVVGGRAARGCLPGR